jgi:CHAT domain-containing protein
MSLWKVSDQATDLMMTCFYRHLMQGHSRHRAFAMAQDDTRRGGFTDPYFWASFVLLDAQ